MRIAPDVPIAPWLRGNPRRRPRLASQRHMRSLAAVVTIALVGSLAVAPPVSAQGDAGSPVALTGTADVSLDDAYFIVHVWPRDEVENKLEDGDEVPLFQLPSNVVLPNGNAFSMRLDPADLPDGYINSDGRVHVELEIVVPGSNLVGNVSATVSLLQVDGTTYWVDPLLPDENDLAGAAIVGAAERVEVSVEMSEAPAAVLNALARPEPAVALTTEPGLMDGCGSIRTELVASRNVWATTGTTYPYSGGTAGGDHKARMVYGSGTSRSTTFGVAVSGSGGSWSSSGTKTTTSGWASEWGFSTVYRTYRAEVRYGKYRKYWTRCGTINYRWQPRYETGGSTRVRLNSKPNYSYCTPVNGGQTWIRTSSTGKAYTNSAGVKFKSVIGINLSSTRQFYSNRRYEYKIVGNSKYMCGKTTYPAEAGLLHEKWVT